MRTLDDFRMDVEEVEGGKYPPRFPNWDEARKALVNEICGNPWRNAEERARAQVLVSRLEGMRGSSAGPVPVAVEQARPADSRAGDSLPQALAADILKRWRSNGRQQPQAR